MVTTIKVKMWSEVSECMSKDQDWNITSFFFHTNRPKIFFPNISRLEKDETFQDSVGTLSSRPAGHNFSILDAGQSEVGTGEERTVGQEGPCLSTENNTKGSGGTRSGQNEGDAAECDKSAGLMKTSGR